MNCAERPTYTIVDVIGVIRNLCDAGKVPERERVLLQRALDRRTARELTSVLHGAGVTHRMLALAMLSDLLVVHILNTSPQDAPGAAAQDQPRSDYDQRVADDEWTKGQRAAALWLAWAASQGSCTAAKGVQYATMIGPHATEERRAFAREVRLAAVAPERSELDRMLAHEEERTLLAAAHREPLADAVARLRERREDGKADEASRPVRVVKGDQRPGGAPTEPTAQRERRTLDNLRAAPAGTFVAADRRSVGLLRRLGFKIEDAQRVDPDQKGYRLVSDAPSASEAASAASDA